MTLTVYSKTVCSYCVQAKQYLKHLGIAFSEVDVENDSEARQFLAQQGHRTVPQIYQGDRLFVTGGWEGLSKLSAAEIHERLAPNNLGTL